MYICTCNGVEILLCYFFFLQATPDTPIIKALNIFHESRVSALPIVDETGKGRHNYEIIW